MLLWNTTVSMNGNYSPVSEWYSTQKRLHVWQRQAALSGLPFGKIKHMEAFLHFGWLLEVAKKLLESRLDVKGEL